MMLFDFAIIIALSSALTVKSGAEFYFKDQSVKFEDTFEGDLLQHSFPFTNIGDEPLIISETKVSCTCTQVTFPKEPIAPGQGGIVHFTFNTAGKRELQWRKIQVFSNASEKPVELSFKVFVIPAD